MTHFVRFPLVSSNALVRAFDPFAPQGLYKSRFHTLSHKMSRDSGSLGLQGQEGSCVVPFVPTAL